MKILRRQGMVRLALEKATDLGKIYWIGWILEWGGLGLLWSGGWNLIPMGMVWIGMALLVIGLWRRLRYSETGI